MGKVSANITEIFKTKGARATAFEGYYGGREQTWSGYAKVKSTAGNS